MNLIQVVALCAGPAHAETAEQVVAKMDTAMNRAQDHVISWEVVNMEPGKKEPKRMAFDVHVRGPKTYTAFQAPADLKDTRVLVLSRTQMYIYLPAYGKVRRIASHMTQQGFMGTSFSNDDMGASAFGDIYQPKLLGEDASTWVVELTPKEGMVTPYAKVEVTVDKEMHHPLQIKDYNDKGTLLKTETRTEYECQQDVCLAGVMRMEDHTRAGAWTELRRTSWKLNTGFSDDVFTTRVLQLGL